MYLSAGELTLYYGIYIKKLKAENPDADKSKGGKLGHQGTVDLATKACKELASQGIVMPTAKQVAEMIRNRA